MLTQKLGLSAYADSDSAEDEEDDDGNNGTPNTPSKASSSESDVDSEEELKVVNLIYYLNCS